MQKILVSCYTYMYCTGFQIIHLKSNGSIPDGSFTMPDLNSFFGPFNHKHETSVVSVYVFMMLFSFSILVMLEKRS